MSEVIFRVVTSGEIAKEKLREGINESANVITDTMGYRGNNNLYETLGGMPKITADGFDSLEELHFNDPIKSMALGILKEACKKTYNVVGDNTSLTCCLTQAFFNASLDALYAGKNDIEIKLDIEKSVKEICDYIDSIAIPLTDELMYNVAKTSAHSDDEIASIVHKAFIQSGEHGTVSHKRSFTDETFIEHIAGNPIESGYTHEDFVNVQENQTVVFDNPLVLCSSIHFQTMNEVIPFLEFASNNSRPLVIISNMENDILTAILSNVKVHKYPFCVIKPPFIGKKGRETMADLALVLGCDVLSGISRSNYDGKEASYMGSCERIEVGKKDTVITQSKEMDKSKINGKIAELTEQIKNEELKEEKQYLRERIAKISGGISTIMVGGITPAEVEEKVARVDDAICAVRSAKDGGIVAGGGVALLNAGVDLELDEVTSKSLTAPFNKIMSNANAIWEPTEIELNYPMGYDVKEYKEVDMIDAGIIDTAKGIKTALISASSASNNLIRTKNIITYERIQHGK